MKSEYLGRRRPIVEYYENGSIKAEKYMIHMSYVVFRYDECGNRTGLTVNGIEYPADSFLEFHDDKLLVKTKEGEED